MEQHLRGSQSPIDVFKYRRRQLSPLAPLQNLIAPQPGDGVSVAGSYGSKGQLPKQIVGLIIANCSLMAQMCKSTTSSGLCTPSPKSHVAHQVMASAVTEAAAAALTSSPKPNNTSELLSSAARTGHPKMMALRLSCRQLNYLHRTKMWMHPALLG
ncbi:uncharacterized protein LOC112175681 isoform X2 [Rosa chinensis]|uniref:uncharacterized protein LOC112175681 isoform X2 n=1 Tax=Rosa chinensis TaxID=74649 RepID=UPI001AD8FFF3|nr:uncharacterized protein LOC112175681 isoform X2 [Rosa chinensis]